MRHGGGTGQVVDGDDLDVRMFHGGPKHQPSDSSKAIDADFDAHACSFSVFSSIE
jgi:hypothetical protein